MEHRDAPSELFRLRRYSNRLALMPDVRTILETIVTTAMELQSADMGSATLYDCSADELYPVVSIGLPEPYLKLVKRIPRGAGACGKVLETGGSILVENTKTDSRFPLLEGAAGVAGYRAVLSVPLCLQSGRLLGTVAVYFRQPCSPSTGRISIMELYTSLGTAFLQQVQLTAEREAERTLFEETNRDLESKVKKGEDRRRALIHIMGDMSEFNKRLGDQRKAMLHILADYERDRSRLARQTENLDNSRRALMHILQDSRDSNLRLARSRKAMIHIMGDLHETTAEIQSREQELRDKQEQLVQAGKLATLGELTTGVAHELNNPLNNIGLFLGNAIDMIELDQWEKHQVLRELQNALQQVRKATEIISHLRTFGRVATVSREPVSINNIVQRAASLMYEQLRLRQIEIVWDLSAQNPTIIGNAIQLEQVFINLLANARDAIAESERKEIHIATRVSDDTVDVTLYDTGPGIPRGMEQRIFDPFFTTKDVGAGTGLGLSITYGIIREHFGSIQVTNRPGNGASFLIQLPRQMENNLERAVI